jgi:uncharacterized membrane protein YccC
MLSIRTKESIKTALAMTISYGIALSMNWSNPYWAGFAVAFISLSTIGQSLNKGAMRMLGTLIAAIVGLTLIGLFSQDRWLFMFFLSVYVGFCTYMMGGTKRQYFWNVCGFVCVIICLDAGANSTNAFNTAVLRAQETGLGILVYGLVSILLWPNNSRKDFDDAVKKLAITQQQYYECCFKQMSGNPDPKTEQTIQPLIVQNQARFNQLLDAAETDSFEVLELRQQWRHYQRLTDELIKAIHHCRENAVDLTELELQRLLPNLFEFDKEISARLELIVTMTANQVPDNKAVAVDLSLDENEVRELSHFQKAALAVTRSQLQNIEQLTRSLTDTISDIKGVTDSIIKFESVRSSNSFFIIDPDRIANVIRVMVIMWIAYLTLIYVDSVPGGSGFVTMASVLGMVMVSMPQIPVTVLFKPVLGSVIFASVVYIFVLPSLSNFYELGLLVFTTTFAICYLYAKPQQALEKTFGLAMFVSIASITNEQTYSFMVPATTAMMFPLIFMLIAITAYIPHSPHPEHAFVRLLERFFHDCEFLVSNISGNRQKFLFGIDGLIERTRRKDIVSLPVKLRTWSQHINMTTLPATTNDQMKSIVTTIQTLTDRIQDLLEVSSHPQSDILVRELNEDMNAWKLTLTKTFVNLSNDPAGGHGETYRIRLREIMERMEKRIKETLDHTQDELFTDSESENFYKLLGAYRSVSESMVEYAEKSEGIDWDCLREERFA